MLLVRTQHESVCEHQKSRLAKQLHIVMNTYVPNTSGATLNDQQRFMLCKELIKDYDPKADNLELTVNNANINEKYNLMKILENVSFSRDGKTVTLKEEFGAKASQDNKEGF